MAQIQSPCYFANGTAVPDEGTFLACPIDPVRTICCALNRTNPAGGDLADGQTADECLSNGICQNRATNNGNDVTTWWINFCTEPDFAGGKCLDICREARSIRGDAQVTPCDGTNNSTRWCCGDTNKCCGTNNVGAVELPQEFVGRVLSSTTVSLPSSTASPTASSTASSSPTVSTPASSSKTAQSQSQSLSAGAKAGIGVGAVCGAIILLGALLFVRKAYSWRRSAKAPKLAENFSYAEESPIEKYRQQGFPPVELPSAATTPTELPAASPIELPGTAPMT